MGLKEWGRFFVDVAVAVIIIIIIIIIVIVINYLRYSFVFVVS